MEWIVVDSDKKLPVDNGAECHDFQSDYNDEQDFVVEDAARQTV